HMSRHVAADFDPDTMIFTIVMNDFDESIHGIHDIPYMMTLEVGADSVREISPVADRNQSQYDPRKRLLKKSALFSYFLYNLKLGHTVRAGSRKEPGGGYVDNTKPARIERHMEEIRRVVDHVVSAIARENPGRRLIFVLDAPRERIYSGGTEPYALEPLRLMTKEACSRSGIEVIDLEAPMTEDFREHGRRFSSEYDNHWDEYGHEIVARTILGHI
ncbi:MAG TPA: hypothetical protein VLA34_12180, partial [Candidatus Krumholzibacterium sp.]|nr:hypothetical protein [Candidatus Krumholzibacterium sp.]